MTASVVGSSSTSRATRLVVGVVLVLAAACASSTEQRRGGGAGKAPLRVVDGANGAELYAGAPAYAWRSGARVARLPSFGELVVGDPASDDRCRLVVAGAGATAITVYERAPCGAVVGKDGRVCLPAAQFIKDGGAQRVVVDGCLDEGELVWDKVDAPSEATVGPTLTHRVCEPVPVADGCTVQYLRLDGLDVESNPDPMRGAALGYEDGGWTVCWLEAHRGRAVARATVRTSCDAAERTIEVVRAPR